MQISAEMVKELREKTQAGVMDCKKALTKTKGNMNKAADLLAKEGLAKVEKLGQRTVSQGLVEAYVHFGGHIGALVEVNCETDFVARTDDFKELAHNLALQVVGAAPLYVSEEDIPDGTDARPDEVCLLRQKFIKDDSKTVQELVKEVSAKMGENIAVKRFALFNVGA